MRILAKMLYSKVDYINAVLQEQNAANPISLNGSNGLHSVELMEDWKFYTVKKTLSGYLSNKECLSYLEGFQDALELLRKDA